MVPEMEFSQKGQPKAFAFSAYFLNWPGPAKRYHGRPAAA